MDGKPRAREEGAVLEQERKYYEENLEAWLARYPGRFVLVKGRELVGAFDTVDGALAEGARRFGMESYLVRRVEMTPDAVKIPALTLGLLNAGSQHPDVGAGDRA